MFARSVYILLTGNLLIWVAWICVCTLTTELVALKTDPLLPIPSATDWPWGGESLKYCG